MVALQWDLVGERLYETGVDRGVLYIPDASGAYIEGFAWNGLVSVSESPTGAETTPFYADNLKYLNLVSLEEFEATVEAFTYPDEFAQFDGTVEAEPGVLLGQQTRGKFGLAYRTLVGNDVAGNDLGYKLHLIYGAAASPTEKSYETINETPDAITFSWDLTTTPVLVTGHKPTASLVIDSTKVDSAKLATFEVLLYGDETEEPELLLPDAVIAYFAAV